MWAQARDVEDVVDLAVRWEFQAEGVCAHAAEYQERSIEERIPFRAGPQVELSEAQSL
eukprot:SAG11_NODE_1137_length_5726_cov_8.585747_2_plen_58_part_00